MYEMFEILTLTNDVIHFEQLGPGLLLRFEIRVYFCSFSLFLYPPKMCCSIVISSLVHMKNSGVTALCTW